MKEKKDKLELSTLKKYKIIIEEFEKKRRQMFNRI